MARMYSRKKGVSGSKRPLKKTTPSWVRYKGKEVEMLITKLAKEEKSPSEIGLILRDSYGVPYVKGLTGKRVNEILEEHKILPKIPHDVTALMRKSIAIMKHIEENHNDETAKRGLILTESKIKRLIKYYKRIGKIEELWKYQPDKIRLILE